MSVKVPIQDLNDTALLDRINGLAMNLFYHHGQFHLDREIENLFQETRDECKRRGMNHTLGVSSYIRADDPPPKFYEDKIIRYGKRTHLEKLMQGIVSFGQSHIYKDAVIDAQRDNEMQRRSLAPNQTITIDGVAYPASNIVLQTQIAFDDRTPIFHHLFCASYEESKKLCRAFHADGYIRIRDRTEFFNIIASEIQRRHPEITLLGNNVRYYDDRAGHNAKTIEDILFSKTIEYFYEREYRIALLDVPQPSDRFEIEIPVPTGLLELEIA